MLNENDIWYLPCHFLALQNQESEVTQLHRDILRPTPTVRLLDDISHPSKYALSSIKVCPKFHHARTAAHNRVRQALFKLLKRPASSDWKLAEETPLFLTGLCLDEVPTVSVQKAGRSDQDSPMAR